MQSHPLSQRALEMDGGYGHGAAPPARPSPAPVRFASPIAMAVSQGSHLPSPPAHTSLSHPAGVFQHAGFRFGTCSTQHQVERRTA